MQRWYVLTVKGAAGGAEAAGELRAACFPTFAPVVRRKARETRKAALRGLTVKQRRHAMRETEEPMFPGYLFVRADLTEDSAADLETVRGVSGFVRFGLTIPHVPDALIAALEAIVPPPPPPSPDEQMVIGILAARARGQTIAMRVTDGPFMGFVTQVERMCAADRVKSLMDIFGRETPMEFALSQLEPAGASL